HMREGRFTHHSIADAEPIPGEEKLGLVAHYSIGVGFAGLLLAWRPGWTERPSLGPAMVIGLGTIAAPWFVMQPAFGLGVAGAKTSDPTPPACATCARTPPTGSACTSPVGPSRRREPHADRTLRAGLNLNLA